VTALITDFDHKKYIINLTSFDGMNADLTSVTTSWVHLSGLPAGTGLFVDELVGNGPNELIAILQGVSAKLSES